MPRPPARTGSAFRALRKYLAVEAGVEVGGTLKKPLVRLVSEPDVPDTEKLSWAGPALLAGYACIDVIIDRRVGTGCRLSRLQRYRFGYGRLLAVSRNETNAASCRHRSN